MSSPTMRSLKYLRQAGWTACVVEKRIPFNHTTIDAFGFADILAMRVWDMTINGEQTDVTVKREIALIQTTTGSHMASRRTKIIAEKNAAYWKAAGGIILLHGWRKIGPRGKRKTWQVNEEIL